MPPACAPRLTAFRQLVRTDCVRLAKKMHSAVSGRSGTLFSPDLARTTSIFLALTASRAPRTSIFELETEVFSSFFSATRRSKRTPSDINKTLAGVVQNAHRSFRAPSRKREKSIRGRSRRRLATRTGSASTPGMSWDRLRAILGASPGALGAPRGALGVLRGIPKAALGRPGRILDRPGGVLAAPRSVPESPRVAPDAPRSILERFLVDFRSLQGRFSFDFRVFRRALSRSEGFVCTHFRCSCAL